MVKEKEGASTGKKIGKIVIWSFAIIGILFIGAIVFFMFRGGNSAALEKFNGLAADYTSVDERFNTEWDLFDPQYTTNVSLQSSLSASQTLLNYVRLMKSNVSDLNILIAEEKKTASGDQLEWWTMVGDCYLKRSEALNNFQDLFTNEIKELNYLYDSNNFAQSLIELGTLEAQSISYGQLGDEQKDIEVLNKMKTKIGESRTYLQNMQAMALGFSYLSIYEQFVNAYEKYIELNLQYYASPSLDLSKQAYDKYNEIQEINTRINAGAMAEEYSTWSTINIKNKRDAASRLITEANQKCSAASNLYSSAFPNANVIKEINNSSN
jgi:hypothetical protein